MTEISRRALLTGATATAASVAFGSILISPPTASATGVDPVVDPDKDAKDTFCKLSAALTGIDQTILRPNVEPFKFNDAVFAKAKAADPKTLQTILGKFSGGAGIEPKTVDQLLHDAEVAKDDAPKFLMRSIILAWYLGAWYDPKELQDKSYKARDTTRYYTTRRYSQDVLIPHEVISPNAYTNGMVWRVAQAHPMGYSNLQFGYWGKEPPKRTMFTKAL
jgi:hypothetical protein